MWASRDQLCAPPLDHATCRSRSVLRGSRFDVSNHSLSAQQIGIAPKPAAKLTEDEWSAVRASAQERQYNDLPCPICQEPFKADDQVGMRCC
jgi:hypothetical protein